jgi:hypothetical protein
MSEMNQIMQSHQEMMKAQQELMKAQQDIMNSHTQSIFKLEVQITQMAKTLNRME